MSLHKQIFGVSATKSISLKELQLRSLLDRFHSAEDCPHRGNCLSKEELIEILKANYGLIV